MLTRTELEHKTQRTQQKPQLLVYKHCNVKNRESLWGAGPTQSCSDTLGKTTRAQPTIDVVDFFQKMNCFEARAEDSKRTILNQSVAADCSTAAWSREDPAQLPTSCWGCPSCRTHIDREDVLLLPEEGGVNTQARGWTIQPLTAMGGLRTLYCSAGSSCSHGLHTFNKS